ncbi:hypothetical protein [Lysobacter silvisoli]|uniref:Uncharacterized protein n=1 Tax=Lysobacter silvisoli TaxID=2293254 RepID=A0A371K273_9GAMM|nr:hypothetical protein [Lysobacter silvisoli]RDZ27972.1 hypothetical protein DX914_02110 [Lysobacter silvisoli]
MKRQTPDPLSPEERALADRLARLGPHEGPSPALDARILAAAHAAAAASPRAPQAASQRARRRWALSAIPGSLITGMGIAATLALAVGVVWQLRPIAPSREAPSHESGDAYTAAEMIQRPRATIAPPPPPADAAALPEARMDRRELSAAAQAPAAAAKPAADVARSAQAFPEPAPPEPRRQRSVPPAPAESMAYGEIAQDAAASAAPMAAPPMPAAAPAIAPAGGAAREDNFGLVPSRSRLAADAAKARADTAEAKQAAAHQERRETDAAKQAYSAQREAEARESVALDRIEVTGSRIKRADVEPAQPVGNFARDAAFPPVGEDQRLERTQWLERIRARRDAGRLDEARASLGEFRKAHPRVRIPADLRALQPR